MVLQSVKGVCHMKKFAISALCCVAACTLVMGGCNKNADSSECSDKAMCSDKSATCADKASCADKAASGCCKSKAAQQN